MPAGDPKHPLPFPFRDLTDDEFDELVYLVAHVMDERVLKTRAPDGGLDTVRLQEADPLRADWGIQAKLHRDQIKWPSCKESLDRAVDQWKVPRVTFAFPRDLTVGQHKNFVRNLVGRQPGAAVDWWGSTKLTAIMIVSAEGRAIAKRFFHAEDPADVVDRATRVGGPLTTHIDLLEREAGLDEFLRTSDPHFDYQTIRRPRSDEEPPVPPNAAMRLEFGLGDRQLFIDALPKTKAALEMYGPRVTAAFKDPAHAAAMAGKVEQHGGRGTLGEATVSLARIPAPFDRLLSELDGTITMRAEREAQPWAARITADTSEGNETLDVDLEPGDAGPDWDARLAGKRNGLTMELSFVWNHDVGHGSMQIHWRAGRITGAAEERARVWQFLVALHGDGTVTFADREEGRPPLTEKLSASPLSPDVLALRDVYRDLAEIQTFAGATFGSTPNDFSGDEAYHISLLAHLLRTGKVEWDISTVAAVSGPDGVAQLRRTGKDIVITEAMVATFFGRDLHVADRVVRLPPMVLQSAVDCGDGQWDVELVPLEKTSAPAVVEFHPPGTRRAP